ncbi:hypothetical protein ACWGH8_39195 [Nonomuraea muscovyensis]|uniref:Uncharacterized protein n=1 Tax=Nonomuraea muscovyensis TaxID=1124761 RepID=A0A7X0C236_9ACTN|nr:hypothetical protein [Nonomuraea muscovyensis]MBB6346927.1 hypothetical protein [Nonomuraea muscovyensis]MDF2704953.1 hypothetical protein [Nonomuraea muscovyensis]
MRNAIRFLGILMILEGVSGTIDQIAVQPFMGIVLNAFNRFVVNRVALFEGYEVFANLALAILGVAVVIAAGRAEGSRAG